MQQVPDKISFPGGLEVVLGDADIGILRFRNDPSWRNGGG